jgi:uncharacterized protein involved in exopolysaccharide biosynthesis
MARRFQSTTLVDMSQADVVQRIHEIVAILREGRQVVWRIMAATVAVGAFYAFGSQPEFTATTRILPYRTAAGTNGLSGLAGLAGIRLPSAGLDPTIPASLYPDVIESVDFMITVAETPLWFGSLQRKASAIDYFQQLHTSYPFEVVTGYTIGLPRRLITVLRSAPQVTPKGSSGDTLLPPVLDGTRKDLLEEIGSRIQVDVDKRNSVVTITGTMPDATASADLIRVVTEQLMAKLLEYESRKANEQFTFVNRQLMQARQRHAEAQRRVAIFLDGNRQLSTAISRIQLDKLEQEVALSFELLQQFEREAEQTRLKLMQDTPIFTVLDQVRIPPGRSEPRRSQVLLLSLLGGLLLGVGWLAVRHLWALYHQLLAQTQSESRGTA